MLPLALALASLLVTPQADTLLTVAEASGFRATSRHADVVAFVDRIARHPDFHRTSFGRSEEGRDLPLVVWGAPDASPEAVRATGRLRVFVLANIHAGEVAGKEAALILLRELAQGRHAAWADSLVLLVAPIYNADGNERIDPRHRPLQHGPVDGMGTRANARGLDLNRDFEKLDAAETRALVQTLDAYDPHVVLDLHTTNGTVHAYHLTYAPALHPNTDPDLDAFVRERWLPAVQDTVRARTGYETFLYGNDKPEWGSPPGWATFDPRPRFATNYVGLRNRIAILSEAYSYATFEERIRATLAFVVAVIDFAHAHASEVARRTAAADRRSIVGTTPATRSAGHWVREGEAVVLLGGVAVEPNPHTGLPMWRRTEARVPTILPLYQRFGATARERVPDAYLVPRDLTDVLERLRLHGIRTTAADFPADAWVEHFQVDSVRVAARPFQQRYERELFGRWERSTAPVDPAAYVAVPMHPKAQPLARLAFLLLEPRSDSGFANWGIAEAEAGAVFPIRRVSLPPSAAGEPGVR